MPYRLIVSTIRNANMKDPKNIVLIPGIFGGAEKIITDQTDECHMSQFMFSNRETVKKLVLHLRNQGHEISYYIMNDVIYNVDPLFL